ncbi:protein GVP36 [Kluyveromyces marxianus]|uniref:Protein GVP36 n=2 Tax=Kluyveromyces marxianus TaxID=4911 RepID=W0T844_KLUMD|nr:protein GVP36 [Kluyveromyces marxianus DMKU3-1042]QGN14701.1 protein GVP36 [Kluyveromyces marxianus]BAO38971.1 protein GVP36 [Kluyveromyces marxianus DMKU3-1042]BAP70501.1 protein GVP36 [Kluyveromyces marxianus]
MSQYFGTFSKKVQELSSSVSQKAQEAQLDQKFKDLKTNTSLFANSTQRLIQEKLGQVTDISQLPDEYTQLENRVDKIKLIYENFLKVTKIYENESYDYPGNIKESVDEFSKTVGGKLHELSKATNREQAQSALLSSQLKEPKTLNYALSKVALTSSEHVEDDVLANFLAKYSDVQTKIAQLRLQQDTMIQTKFNKAIKEKLDQEIAASTKARKLVEQKRLQYDVVRSNRLKNTKPEKQAALQVEESTYEEEFAKATDDAIIAMSKVVELADFTTNLQELVAAQLAYHKNSAELLEELVNES